MAADDRMPPSPEALAGALARQWLGRPLPVECLTGVAVNLAALADHLAIVTAALDECALGEAG